MPWVYLVLAGLLEIVWAFAMKQSDGFTRFTPTLIMIVAMGGSFALLALAMRSLPLSVSYMSGRGLERWAPFWSAYSILARRLRRCAWSRLA